MVLITSCLSSFATEKPMRITGSVEEVEATRQKVEQVLAAKQQKLEVINFI